MPIPNRQGCSNARGIYSESRRSDPTFFLVKDAFDSSTVFSIVPVSRGNLSERLCEYLSGHGDHDPAAEFVGTFTPYLSIFFEGSNEAAYLTFAQAELLCYAGDGHARIFLRQRKKALF